MKHHGAGLRQLTKDAALVAQLMTDFRQAHRNILFPPLFHFLVVVEIEPAFDDLPGFRVAVCSIAVAHRPGAIPTILRRVLLRIACKQVPVGGAHKMPLRSEVAAHQRVQATGVEDEVKGLHCAHLSPHPIFLLNLLPTEKWEAEKYRSGPGGLFPTRLRRPPSAQTESAAPGRCC